MILVTGATGNVGREIVQQLHDSGHRVRVLSRNPATVQVLLSSGHEGQIYTLTGPEILTAKDQARTLGDVLGEHIRFEDIPQAIAKENMKRFAPGEFVDAMFQLMQESSKLSTTVTLTVEDITGNSARTFAQWAKDNADKFR